MKKFAKWVIGIIGSFFIVLMAAQFIVLRPLPNHHINSTDQQANVCYTRTPTILIPGWGGNSTTYHKLVQTYQQKQIAQKVMTVWVSPSGQVRTRGSYHDQKNALIQVLYNWNYNASYHPQVHQLDQVLQVLHARYGINKMNVIAHSYGGTEFMHAYFGSPILQHQIKLQKVIFLGVPVEESFGVHVKFVPELFKKSHDRNFKELVRQMTAWAPNKDVAFYNIMGGSDDEVPKIQSEMLQSLVRIHPQLAYHQVVVPHTNHFQLHNRAHILNGIAQILWSAK